MSRKYADYTVGDIIRTTPTWFKNKQSGTQYPEVLTLIHSICESGFLHLLNKSFFEIFGDYDICKPDFNAPKCLYEANSNLQALSEASHNRLGRISGAISCLTHAQLLSMAKTNNKALLDEIESMEADIQEAERYIDQTHEEIASRQSRINTKYTAIAKWRAQMESHRQTLEKGTFDVSIIHSLRRIPKHWVISKVADGVVKLVRTKRVVHTMTNVSTKVAQSVDFGYLQVTLDLASAVIIHNQFLVDYIDPRGGALHPHLTASSVCWGNVSHKIDEARRMKDYATIFELLDAILETYGESPYREFDWYYRNRAARIQRTPNANDNMESLRVLFSEGDETCKDIVRPLLASLNSDSRERTIQRLKEYAGNSAAFSALYASLHEALDEKQEACEGDARLTRAEVQSIALRHKLYNPSRRLSQVEFRDLTNNGWNTDIIATVVAIWGDMQTRSGWYSLGTTCPSVGSEWELTRVDFGDHPRLTFEARVGGIVRDTHSVYTSSEREYQRRLSEANERREELAPSIPEPADPDPAPSADRRDMIAQAVDAITASMVVSTSYPHTTIRVGDRDVPAAWMDFSAPTPETEDETETETETTPF